MTVYLPTRAEQLLKLLFLVAFIKFCFPVICTHNILAGSDASFLMDNGAFGCMANSYYRSGHGSYFPVCCLLGGLYCDILQLHCVNFGE